MKRLALILFFLGPVAPLAWADPNPTDQLFHQADDAEKAGKWDDAVNFYEQVITNGQSTDINAWYSAQSRIVNALAKKGDFASAAQHAHICIDAATNLGAFDDAVRTAANILSAQDKNVDRANQFLAFQQSGPAGGKTNPMDAVGYPSMPDRETAFTNLRAQAGEDASASRFRAYTYLYSGKPHDALAQFSDTFRRNNNPYDFTNGGMELVLVGLRAARGYRVGLDEAMKFVIHGPNGPDGKPNTPDDIPDPFSALMPAVPPPGQGGLAGTDPTSLAALRKVNDAALLYAGDPLAPVDTNRMVHALERSNIALDNWGAPGQVDWFIRLELGLGCPPPGEYTGEYLNGLYYAARGRGNNYGGITTVWNQVTAEGAAHNVKLTDAQQKNFDRIHDQFGKDMTNLANIQYPKIDFQPLKQPATF
jgi:tetratricopeptide (TPR) repeat protein